MDRQVHEKCQVEGRFRGFRTTRVGRRALKPFNHLMPPKKKRSHNIKGLRGTQDQQPPHQFYDSSRLKPEQVGALVHDESDIISYRAYLLQNVIRSSEMMDALTTQNIPLSKVQAPHIYRSLNIDETKRAIEAEKEQLQQIEQQLQNYDIGLSEDCKFLRKLSDQIDIDNNQSPQPLGEVESAYQARFEKHVQGDRFVVHRDKFPQLRGDHSKAPPDYWEKRQEMLNNREQEALRLKMMQEEEELKRSTEEANRLRQKEEEEQQLFEDPFQQQGPSLHSIPANNTTATNVLNDSVPVPQTQQQQQQQQEQQQQQQQQQQPNDQSQQAMMGSIFGDMNGENFNNGFEDDEFADLDSAFF